MALPPFPGAKEMGRGPCTSSIARPWRCCAQRFTLALLGNGGWSSGWMFRSSIRSSWTTRFSMDWFKGKFTGNHGFYMFLPSNIGVSCKFSHHPVLWYLDQKWPYLDTISLEFLDWRNTSFYFFLCFEAIAGPMDVLKYRLIDRGASRFSI